MEKERMKRTGSVLIFLAAFLFVAVTGESALAQNGFLPEHLSVPKEVSAPLGFSPIEAVSEYMPESYTTHTISGYTTVVLAITAMVTQDDSGLHKGSGIGAAVAGIVAGTSGHMAYGDAIDFSEGVTMENIHVACGYVATAGLVVTAILGVLDEGHAEVGGASTALVTLPVLVIAF